MGIKGLFQLLEKEAPNSFRQIDIKVYTGKTVTCDASNVDHRHPGHVFVHGNHWRRGHGWR